MNPKIDRKRALTHLMDLLAVEGLSGREGRVAEAVKDKLVAAGCRSSWIGHDDANRRIEGDYEVGNLVVKIPGRGRRGRRRLLFMGHLDTVPLCRGAVPIKRGRRIVSKGKTALGGDNRTSIGALVTLVETMLSKELPRPPLTLLMTVGEEVGLKGATHVDLARLGDPEAGFNIDGGDPARITIGAIGADRWHAHVHGRSSHAGVHPDDGVSAALIASRAIAEVAQNGYFGKVEKGRRRGISNVGILQGGEATNQVTDYVYVKGESRSHSPSFLDQITRAYRRAFEKAAKQTRNRKGVTGRVEFLAERDYDAFRMPKTSLPVGISQRAVRSLGLEPSLVIADGGLDANQLNAKGIPTVTLGAGQHNPHTVDEYIDLSEYYGGCQLLVEIACTA